MMTGNSRENGQKNQRMEGIEHSASLNSFAANYPSFPSAFKPQTVNIGLIWSDSVGFTLGGPLRYAVPAPLRLPPGIPSLSFAPDRFAPCPNVLIRSDLPGFIMPQRALFHRPRVRRPNSRLRTTETARSRYDPHVPFLLFAHFRGRPEANLEAQSGWPDPDLVGFTWIRHDPAPAISHHDP
jgi:hypothetical protein